MIISRQAGHEACMGRKNVYKILVGKPEGKRQLGRPRQRWEDNIKINPKEIGLADDRNQWWAVVKTVMNLWVS
jgi:hypothetical protein